MNPNTNTIQNLSVEDQVFYDRVLLERLLPELHFYTDAKKKKIPKRGGTSIEWRTFKPLSIPTTPLTEGVTPDGNTLDIQPTVAKLKQYGDYVTVSDVLDTQSKDPVITETAELEGEQAALLVDTLIRDEVSSGTNVRYAGGGASPNVQLKGDDIKKGVRDLKKYNAKRFPDGYFHAVITPEQAYDLMSDTAAGGWLDATKYTDNKPLLQGEIGRYAGVRFMESSNGKKAGDIHSAIIYGKDSYGTPEIGETAAKPTVIVKTAEKSGTSDPLNQRSTIGWKNMFTAKRLQENAILRIESLVSA